MDKIEMSQSDFLKLKQQARDGERYVRFLKGEIRRIGKLIGEPESATFATEGADVLKLQRVLNEYKKRWDNHRPPVAMSQISTRVNELPADPETQKIYDGLGVTPEDVERYGKGGKK
jgi:hypothetical protein